MLFSALSLALALASIAPRVAAINCGVCAPSIVYAGLTRTLTLQAQETGNTVQCNYDSPAIAGFNPLCLYANVNGALIATDTAGSIGAVPGACPTTIPVIVKTTGTC